MTPVSFVKTTNSKEVSLVTINWQTSYDSDILRQDSGIIQGLPMNHTRFADWVIGLYIYQNGPKRADLITALDQTVRAVHSCNNCCCFLFLFFFFFFVFLFFNNFEKDFLGTKL